MLFLLAVTCCKEFQKKFGDIDSDKMSAELQRFVLILQKKRNLNTAQDFLNYLLKTHLFELYPNVYIALRILLTCPVTVTSAERSFSKLKLIKTFNRTSMTDSRLSSLAMLSIENDCARSLDYDNVIYKFFMFFSVIVFVSQCLHKCPTELWHRCRIFYDLNLRYRHALF